jgi:hypothetical protein
MFELSTILGNEYDDIAALAKAFSIYMTASFEICQCM